MTIQPALAFDLCPPSEENELERLYASPLPSTRGGPFFSAFSYPTKISPESIAVYIACHTSPGDTVLDVFAGSGTTGVAALLCARPTDEMLRISSSLGVSPEWGARKAVLVELGVLGAFVSKTLCDHPDSKEFLRSATQLLDEVEGELGGLYAATDPHGQTGSIRHIIWSDILRCRRCRHEQAFWDCAVALNPAQIKDSFQCSNCGHAEMLGEAERVYETYRDSILGCVAERRKRVPARIHGETNGKVWQRLGTADDLSSAAHAEGMSVPECAPVAPIPWGDLYRSGYHRGLSHAHHFYTRRNFIVFSALWDRISRMPASLQDSLKFLLLSYNATHGTIMTRVVAKSGQPDLVLTGAQSGVLYVSSLPVEKNIFLGLRRKANVIARAFSAVPHPGSNVRVINGSSTKLDLASDSIDYLFTDPPFGNYIPYAELNFLNEVWLGSQTDARQEVIISPSQGKTAADYGNLMRLVFNEANRVLKSDGKATVVFHSAKAEVWQSLQQAYSAAGFTVRYASILDKLQGSFKQVTSPDSVKGDPLLLLEKSSIGGAGPLPVHLGDPIAVEILNLVRSAHTEAERAPERLFSRYVASRLERGLPVQGDASDFYARARVLLEAK